MLCGKDGGQMNVGGNEGLNMIIRASTEMQVNDIHEELIRLQQSQYPKYAHHNCCRFVDLPKRTDSLPRPKKPGSSTDEVFKWETCSLLCLKPVALRNRIRDQVHQVCTLPIQATLIQCAEERNDDWGQAVLARLETFNDLVAAEAV